MKEIKMELGECSYNITIGCGLLRSASEFFRLERAALVVTDDNIPQIYAESVASCAKRREIYKIPEGEGSKSIDALSALLGKMTEMKLTRSDCVIAVGGGVVGDLSGLAASLYMRGIDFYNVPTSLLAMVDSSIGGKTAINHAGIKNIVGAFYQPKKVVIDPDTLKTLDARQLHAGLAEAIKMSLTSDKELFSLIESSNDLDADLDDIIIRSLKIKKSVVEEDPKEKGLRKVLNFGHTVGHAVESSKTLGAYLHGECVAIGMVCMSSQNVRERLIPVLKKYDLPTRCDTDKDTLMSYLLHDKKMSGKTVTAVYVSDVGSFEFIKLDASLMKGYLDI